MNPLFVFFLLFIAGNASAQLQFKLALMPNGSTWGVFVKPDSSLQISEKTVTGSGQITIVAPSGFTYANVKNHSGMWLDNSRAYRPKANPDFDYISFGFITDQPHISYKPGKETLLITFDRVGKCPDTLYLIDNKTDPIINSPTINAGNEISVLDLGNLKVYQYTQNYAPTAWNCHSVKHLQRQSAARPVALKYDRNSHNSWFTISSSSTPDWLKLQFPRTVAVKPKALRLFDKDGKLLKFMEVPAGISRTKLDWGELPSGKYSLTFEINGEVLHSEELTRF